MAMSASATRRLPRLLKTQDPFRGPPRARARAFNFLVSEHTAKWLQVLDSIRSWKFPHSFAELDVDVRLGALIVACAIDQRSASSQI
ncbi:unnamed protein product [Musa acuminata subsp. malaccensis]|uniref:(wild Malaysian banana) hypothetical protein n=1 Tax=Musa acuminata subsp. malaccensis TaxID=214687 RepID=A0A8D7A4C1_MUSAM|nr:unnamed protein product [Musa acuminata subsp. malaccensis]